MELYLKDNRKKTEELGEIEGNDCFDQEHESELQGEEAQGKTCVCKNCIKDRYLYGTE